MFVCVCVCVSVCLLGWGALLFVVSEGLRTFHLVVSLPIGPLSPLLAFCILLAKERETIQGRFQWERFRRTVLEVTFTHPIHLPLARAHSCGHCRECWERSRRVPRETMN